MASISHVISESVCGVCVHPDCVVSARARELAILVFERDPMPIPDIEEVAGLLVMEEATCKARPCKPAHRPWHAWISGRLYCYACRVWEPQMRSRHV